jgi:hypothetical protein
MNIGMRLKSASENYGVTESNISQERLTSQPLVWIRIT